MDRVEDRRREKQTMQHVLLRTKLHIPRVHKAHLVSRRRLMTALKSGAPAKLTLVSAPAGYGKTTLLSEWARRAKGSVAWLSLDADDSIPSNFWSYFIAALQTVDEQLGQGLIDMLQGPQPPAMQTVLALLINYLADHSRRVTLVLDDYHQIEDPAIHQDLAYFLERSPAQFYLILSTRADPPLPLARIRGRTLLNELRAADLCFSAAEAAAFFNQVMSLELADEEVLALVRRTEGWAAGLQLAALSLKQRGDRRAFINAFAGDNHFVADYLIEEVLGRQPAEIQDFLLQTSILPRLCGSLCAAVTGRADSHRLLDSIDRNNLFITSLDNRRHWFRYHQLFAQLLRERLKQSHSSDQLTRLHQRASHWYEAHRFPHEALAHAVSAGERERAVELVEAEAAALINQGRLATLLQWLALLPPGEIERRPWIGIARAWALLYMGQLDEASTILQAVGQMLPDVDDPEVHRMRGYWATIQAGIAAYIGDDQQRNHYARQALEHLPNQDVSVRCLSGTLLGIGLRWQGDLAGATQILAQANRLAIAASNDNMFYAASYLGQTYFLQGKLRQSATVFQEALRFAEARSGASPWNPPLIGLVHAHLSRVLYEWNDLDGALYHAQTGSDLSRQWGNMQTLFDGCFFLSAVQRARGKYNEASEAVSQARQIAASLPYRWVKRDVAEIAARLCLVQGDVQSAAQAMEEAGLAVDDLITYQHLKYYLVLARVCIVQGQYGQALELLSRSWRVAESAGAISEAIEIQVLQATARHQQGDPRQALDHLSRALTMAEPEGYLRVFLDEGSLMSVMLRRLTAENVHPDYILRLQAGFDAAATAASPAPSVPGQALTERESQVLRLLSLGLSSTEVAMELTVSVGTARTHIKHIYRKLDVHSRLEAVNLAVKRNLL